jgi:hypothetical protein
MIFLRDKLSYAEVQRRFEKEGYTLLSTEYKNAKSNMTVLCPCGHEWQTNISNFETGRRCSACSKRKKRTLDEAKSIFTKEGYQVKDSIYINGKTPIKVTCDNGHETAISLNNFENGRRCGFCRWAKIRDARMKKLELKTKSEQGLPRRDVKCTFTVKVNLPPVYILNEHVKEEWLDKIDEMRKSLRSSKRRTYRE